MEGFTNKNNDQPNDEFDEFLREVNETATTELPVSPEEYTDHIQNEWFELLKENGDFLGAADAEDIIQLKQSLINEAIEAGGVDMKLISKNVEETMIRMLEHHATISTIIQFVRSGADYDLMTGQYDEDKVVRNKRALYAQLIVDFGLDPNDPIITAMNQFIPGPVLSHEDEELMPHMLEAVERVANSQERYAEWHEIYNALHVHLGISHNSDLALKSKVNYIVSIARAITGETSNVQANRTEQIFSMGRRYELDAEMIHAIVQYVDQRFPLN